eukprot:4818802-Pleurochrysis_carterae.AAC.2
MERGRDMPMQRDLQEMAYEFCNLQPMCLHMLVGKEVMGIRSENRGRKLQNKTVPSIDVLYVIGAIVILDLTARPIDGLDAEALSLFNGGHWLNLGVPPVVQRRLRLRPRQRLGVYADDRAHHAVDVRCALSEDPGRYDVLH